MRIYLIGMPGCGKSTLGKKLAIKLDYKFIDMDLFIEKRVGISIERIFSDYGENYFRQKEKDVLKQFLTMDNIIIATGGGVIKDNTNKDLMDGEIIYLQTSIEELKKRLNSSKTIRPLLNKYSVEQLYEDRKEKYDYFSNLTIINDDINKAIESIMEALK